MTPGFDAFEQLLRALVASADPSPPRGAAEHALAIAAAAFAAWQAATSDPSPRTVPVGEVVGLRRRLRMVEAERDELQRQVDGAPHAQLPPSRGGRVGTRTTS